jgi:hypothetical protein
VGFTAALALALGALVVLPWVAHRLRRSPPRDEPFAPLRFVPEASGPSDVPRGIDDRWLFAVRALVVLLLALLAAGPRLRASTLRVREGDGDASVVLVLDDSASMRTRESGGTRLSLAKAALRKVLDDLDGGDRAALVLAGTPARVVRGFSQDLQAIRAAVEAVDATDRATDVAGALDRAEELAGEEPGAVVVVATDGRGSGGPRTFETKLPLHVAAVPAARHDDCAVIAVHAQPGVARARVACQAAAKRGLRWFDDAREYARVEADLREGVTEVVLHAEGAKASGRVELVTGDSLPDDDGAPIVLGGARMRIGVVDRSVGVDDEERTPPTLLRALEAVAPEAEIARLAHVPTEAALASLDVLAIDHAVPWTADERLAVQGALEGGLSLWLAFGPASAEGGLGASFEPLVEGPVRWEPGAFRARLGDDGSAPVGGRARFVLGGSARVAATFEDDAPFLVHAALRGGMATIAAVPADPRFGDVALRPAYVDAVAAVVDEARRLRPHGDVRAGERLPVPADAEVVGPRGPIEVERADAKASVDLAHAGELRIRARGGEQVRVVALDEAEVLGGTVEVRSTAAPLEPTPQLRDRSTWVAVALLAALVAELALRYGLRARRASSP